MSFPRDTLPKDSPRDPQPTSTPLSIADIKNRQQSWKYTEWDRSHRDVVFLLTAVDAAVRALKDGRVDQALEALEG